MEVIGRIALLNLTLAGAAIILALAWTPARGALGVLVAVASVGAILAHFGQRRAGP